MNICLENYLNSLNKCYDRSSCFIKFWSSETIARCQIHILMKKADILRKMQVATKPIAPLIFNHFSLSLSRKKVMETMRKKPNTVADLSDIRIGNVNWCKCRHCKKEAWEIDCLCCREVDAISDEEFEGILKGFVFTWIMKEIINTISLPFETKWRKITLL